MDLSIGVIGTGRIGADHVDRITTEVPGGRVAAVYDLDQDRAAEVAAPVGAKVHTSAEELIGDPGVDGILIASPGPFHAEHVLACLAVGKPVLCEKPLATSTAESRAVLEAELALGRRLLQVGFMRRYDHAYLDVKATLDGGTIGVPLLMHCMHRNPTVPSTFTTDMAMTDSIIHEIDVTRWLFGDEIVATQVLHPRRTPHAEPHLQDPQIVLLEIASGALVDVEIFVNCRYGYDVRAEVVGSEGMVALETPTAVTVTRDGSRAAAIPDGWRTRFEVAFRDELRAWVAAVAAGAATGPSAWDGYAAIAVAEACVRALDSGERVEVALTDRPALYAA